MRRASKEEKKKQKQKITHLQPLSPDDGNHEASNQRLVRYDEGKDKGGKMDVDVRLGARVKVIVRMRLKNRDLNDEEQQVANEKVGNTATKARTK